MPHYKIALDAMGGDFGPSVVVPAALNTLKKHPNVEFVLVGLEEAIMAHLPHGKLPSRIEIKAASEVIEMDESPAAALRGKRDSSMRVALNLVKEDEVKACVSAGNTGALMVLARFVLRTLPGIDRPAIISAMPTADKNAHVRILDLGANVGSTSEQLFQFAVMGSILTASLDKLDAPRVALLNVGKEEIKGTEQIKQTAALLSKSEHINYIGYIEADTILNNVADVIVCDGFTGNILLKTTEGITKLIGQLLKEEFHRNILTKMVGIANIPILRHLKQRIDPGRHNGATLVGLKGIVIKSHGGATTHEFEHAIIEAINEVKFDIPSKISDQVAKQLL